MSDDRKRATVRLSQESYDRLCNELTTFSTDTARFQFVVQFYLDYKQTGRLPREWDDCTDDAEGTDAPNDSIDAQQSSGQEFSRRDGGQYHCPPMLEEKQRNHQADQTVDSR